ncbi:unnamed protein product [Peniophora sp. CBMAI 1063]|nr:unnamed protein product [Peniophora sp. CBMAI 1063]
MNTRKYNRKTTIDRKTGKLRYGRTKAAEAAERAQRFLLPSVLAVEAPGVSGGASDLGTDNVEGSREDGGADRIGVEDEETRAGPADHAGPAGLAAGAEPAGPAGYPEAYNYARDEPTWGVYSEQPEHFEIPQAKRRGPVRYEVLRLDLNLDTYTRVGRSMFVNLFKTSPNGPGSSSCVKVARPTVFVNAVRGLLEAQLTGDVSSVSATGTCASLVFATPI